MPNFQVLNTYHWLNNQLRAMHINTDTLMVSEQAVRLNGKMLLRYDSLQEVIYLPDGSIYNCRLQTFRTPDGKISWNMPLSLALKKAVDMQ